MYSNFFLNFFSSHGTRCAGAAAANANNSVCGVGIAYEADIAGKIKKKKKRFLSKSEFKIKLLKL